MPPGQAQGLIGIGIENSSRRHLHPLGRGRYYPGHEEQRCLFQHCLSPAGGRICTFQKNPKKRPVAWVARLESVSYVLATVQQPSYPLHGTDPMPTVLCGIAALAVASIYYLWRAYHRDEIRRKRVLRER